MPQDTAPTQGKILVVDDELNARQTLVMLLEDIGYQVRQAADGFKALGVLQTGWQPDVMLTDLRMPLMDGLELLGKVKELSPDITCIVMTAFASVETAVEAMKQGADDYLTKPLSFDAVELIVARAIERANIRKELVTLRQAVAHHQKSSRTIVGSSPAIKRMIELIDQVAPARATVLIQGESGTGKELVARRLHSMSNRSGKPFVALHCASLPDTLLESELFGHEKGAFTGAIGRRKGRFEEANGGTLFLDEIGDISPQTQLKLLRVLQERNFERIGGNQTVEVDVRIICATHRNLRKLVADGDFREDLYYRLNVITVETPPLRTRREDIPLLARHLVAKLAEQNERSIEEITPEAIRALEGYRWPGNVRELENILERAVVLTQSETIDVKHFPADLLEPGSQDNKQVALDEQLQIPGSTLEDIERFVILKTYESCGGNTFETSRMLGISQRKIQYRLRQYREEGVLDN